MANKAVVRLYPFWNKSKIDTRTRGSESDVDDKIFSKFVGSEIPFHLPAFLIISDNSHDRPRERSHLN